MNMNKEEMKISNYAKENQCNYLIRFNDGTLERVWFNGVYEGSICDLGYLINGVLETAIIQGVKVSTLKEIEINSSDIGLTELSDEDYDSFTNFFYKCDSMKYNQFIAIVEGNKLDLVDTLK